MRLEDVQKRRLETKMKAKNIDMEFKATGMFSAVMLGTVVDGSVAEQFRKAIEPYPTDEVIKALVYSVINGDVKVEKAGGEA